MSKSPIPNINTSIEAKTKTDTRLAKLTKIFILAFALNLIWENLHSHLYVHYMGQDITEFILLHATFIDAIIISLLSAPFIFFEDFFRKYQAQHIEWLIALAGLIIAIVIEVFAMETGRWAYNELMPIIHIGLNIGLTPIVQLAILGQFSFWFVVKRVK